MKKNLMNILLTIVSTFLRNFISHFYIVWAKCYSIFLFDQLCGQNTSNRIYYLNFGEYFVRYETNDILGPLVFSILKISMVLFIGLKKILKYFFRLHRTHSCLGITQDRWWGKCFTRSWNCIWRSPLHFQVFCFHEFFFLFVKNIWFSYYDWLFWFHKFFFSVLFLRTPCHIRFWVWLIPKHQITFVSIMLIRLLWRIFVPVLLLIGHNPDGILMD